MFIFNFLNKDKLGTFMCCKILDWKFNRTFIIPGWPSCIANQLGWGKKILLLIKRLPVKYAGLMDLPVLLITVQIQQKHPQTLFRAICFVNWKSFLSKIMQNALEGNCKTFRMQETYFDDFWWQNILSSIGHEFILLLMLIVQKP